MKLKLFVVTNLVMGIVPREYEGLIILGYFCVKARKKRVQIVKS